MDRRYAKHLVDLADDRGLRPVSGATRPSIAVLSVQILIARRAPSESIGSSDILGRMRWFLLFALGSTGVIVTGLCIMVLLVRHRLHRHHRVDPSVPTEAPISWLIDPRTPARLHRRLARVGTTATMVAEDNRPAARRLRKAEPSPLATAADDLCAQAVLLDRQVARLAVLAPGARRRPLAELGAAIVEVEAAGARLIALSTQVRAPRGLATDDSTLTDITQRIDRLAHAHQELLALDADAGLAASPLPAPPLPPAPTSRASPAPQATPPRQSAATSAAGPDPTRPSP